MCLLFFKIIFSFVKGVNVICLISIGFKVWKKDFGECCKDLLIWIVLGYELKYFLI